MPPMSTLLRNARSEVWPFVAHEREVASALSPPALAKAEARAAEAELLALLDLRPEAAVGGGSGSGSGSEYMLRSYD